MSMMAGVRQGHQAAHSTSMEHATELCVTRNFAMQHTSACYLSMLARTVRGSIDTKVQTAQQLWQGNAGSTQRLIVMTITTV